MVAEALSDWLPRVIQAIKPFHSSEIDKGAKWSNEIDDALEGTYFGIICLTPDNLDSPWIHYEVGALSKATKDSSIWTFLLELKPSDVRQPLGKFQHTLAQKAEVLKMLQSINAKIVEPLKDSLLEESFNDLWPKLEIGLAKAIKVIENEASKKGALSGENVRNENDKLDEILEILRNQLRQDEPERSTFLSRRQILHEEAKHRTYSKLEFEVARTDSKYDRAVIEKYTEQFFPISTMEVAESRSRFFVELFLEPPLEINFIDEYLGRWQSQIGNRINYYVATAEDGHKKTKQF